jgi:hypothetical protein
MRLIIYSTSAPEFKRQAHEALRVWKAQGYDVWAIPIETVDTTRKRRWEIVEDSFYFLHKYFSGSAPYIDVVAIYCHGWKNSIEIGYRSADVDKLAALIAPLRSVYTVIALWCCNTGKPNGFGQKLSAAAGQTVIAHTNAGHTTGNPNKVLFTNGVPRGRLNDALGISWSEWKNYSRRGRVDETEMDIIADTVRLIGGLKTNGGSGSGLTR